MVFLTFNLFIYLTAINTIKSNNNKVISLPFSKDDSLVIEVSMGSRRSSNHLVLNQNIDYLWTIAHFWKISESSSANQLQNTTIDHVSGSFEGIIVEDIFYFKEEDKFIQFAFKYSNHLKIIPFNSGELGLPFKFQNKAYSLVHILKENNLINNLSYSITFYHNRDTYNDYNKFHGNIYFGGIPNDLIKDKKAFKCKVDTNYSTWGCIFKGISIQDINGNEYISSQLLPSYFQTKEQFIHVPFDYYNHFKEEFFKDYLNNKTCLESTFHESYYIYCKQIVIPQLSLLTIHFGDITFKLPFNLIVRGFGKYEMIMIKNEKKQNSHWVFGYSILEEFHTVFDYENEVIMFYERNNTNNIKIEYKYKVLIMLYMLICVICLFDTFLLFIINTYLKRK